MPDHDRSHAILQQTAAFLNSVTADMTDEESSAARLYSLSILLSAQLGIDAKDPKSLDDGVAWIAAKIADFARDFHADYPDQGPQFPERIFDMDQETGE